MMNNIEKVLAEKGICVTATKGDSMNPMLVEGRDKVVVVTPKFPLKKSFKIKMLHQYGMILKYHSPIKINSF